VGLGGQQGLFLPFLGYETPKDPKKMRGLEKGAQKRLAKGERKKWKFTPAV